MKIIKISKYLYIFFWLGEEDSNPRKQVQSLSSYHWTIPQSLTSLSTISKSLTGVKGKKAHLLWIVRDLTLCHRCRDCRTQPAVA